MTSTMDKLPPNSPESEACLIGSIIHKPELMMKLNIEPSDFYGQRNQQVFEAMTDVWKDNRSLDIVLLNERMKSLKLGKDNLDEIEGYCGTVPSGLLGENFAKDVIEKAILRNFIITAGEAITDLSTPGPDSAQDRATEYVKRLRNVSERAKPSSLVSLKETSIIVQNGMVDGEAKNERRIPTGYPDLDDMIGGGMVAGNVYCIGGKTSDGKTTTAVNFAAHQAKAGEHVLFITREMLAVELGRAFLANHLQTPYGKLTPCPKNRSKSEWNDLTAEQLEKLKLFQGQESWNLDFDSAARTVTEVEAVIRKAEELDRPYSILYVDHLHLMRPPKEHLKEGWERQLASIAEGLKEISLVYRMPVGMLAQLNRQANAETEPQIHHLKGSGAIEQVAKTIILVYLKDAEKANSFTTEYTWFIRKNRFGGLGKIVSTWDKAKWLITSARRHYEAT